VLVLVLILLPSSSRDAVLPIFMDAAAGECHVGGRRRGRDDCRFGRCEQTMDLKEPDDDALSGGKIGDDGDSVNPALEPDEEAGKCGVAGNRSITGGLRSRGGRDTIVRRLTFVLALGRLFGLRSAARSGSSASKLKL
jgi:hypothetical protein